MSEMTIQYKYTTHEESGDPNRYLNFERGDDSIILYNVSH